MLLVTTEEGGALSPESLAGLAKAKVALEREKAEHCSYGVLAVSPLASHKPFVGLLRKAIGSEWRHGEPKWAPRGVVGAGATLIEKKKAAAPPLLVARNMRGLYEELITDKGSDKSIAKENFVRGTIEKQHLDRGRFVWFLVKDGGELWVKGLLQKAKTPRLHWWRSDANSYHRWMGSLWGATVIYTEHPRETPEPRRSPDGKDARVFQAVL